MISTLTGPRVRVAGAFCLVGTVVAVVAGLHVTLVTPAAESLGRLGYPYTSVGSQVAHLVYALTHLLLAAGLVALQWSDAMGTSRVGRIGVWIAVAGVAGLTGCEVWAGHLAGYAYPSPATNLLDAGFGLSSLALGTGLVLAGVAVARAGAWTGWRRGVVLATGVTLFVLVIPAMAIASFLVVRLALIMWSFVVAAMSVALLSRRVRDEPHLSGQLSSYAAEAGGSGPGSGRQCDDEITPGSTNSSPSKNPAISSGLRKW